MTTNPCTICDIKLSNCWEKPKPKVVSHDVGLKIMNSLTREKEEFITMDGSRSVKWYMCGPTVYAPSHMGHARTYLGFDIIRRILVSYFGYDVTLVMNITDLDDKIIQRANEQNIPCTELSQKFEAEFHDDMQNLNVSPPDILTRVTEYMPKIVTYIDKIVEKKLAYESNGSVYFNVDGFSQTDGMNYGKLAPESIGNKELLAEGEGNANDHTGDKKSSKDFALWKRSKEGEPTWDSPWGPGRPGWHIECSVMASDIFSQIASSDEIGQINREAGKMDIHSGGVDLKFPHHENEMAQAEAQSGCSQWVNYFVHSGHLHIDGFKMSKSLKNFITIQQALEINTARQMRMCFLLHKYNAPMDYGDNTMNHAVVREKFFSDFFQNVKANLRATPIISSQEWDERAKNMQNDIQQAKKAVNDALCDDFDTPTTFAVLSNLVKAVNKYLENNDHIVSLLVRNAAVFVTKMFRVFGLIPDGSGGGEIGWSVTGSDDAGVEDSLTPILDALMKFRSNVRDKARSKDSQGVLAECDTFRDVDLPPLGVRLEDKATGSVWKLMDPKDIEQLEEEKKRKEQEKAEAMLAAKKLKEQKDALNKLTPEEFMKKLTIEADGKEISKYSKFDESGMPTHFHTGEPLNKNQGKKAAKEFQGHVKKSDNILMAGCGNSRLSEDMYDDGYTTVANVDISRVVIDQMIEKYRDKPTLTWQQMNVCALEFPDEAFDACVMKACVDAILCGEGSTANVAKMCQEVSRVLKPEGLLFIVSYGVPDNRLSYLENEDYGWTVTVHTVPKPTVSATAVPDTKDANSVHYVYVCKKGGAATE